MVEKYRFGNNTDGTEVTAYRISDGVLCDASGPRRDCSEHLSLPGRGTGGRGSRL